MRKVVMLFLAIITGMFFCSCSFGKGNLRMDHDRKIANEKFEEMIQVIQSKDKERLQSLFSKQSLKNANSFEDSIRTLFDYFDGEMESYHDWGGPFVDTFQEDNQIIQVIELTYDVKTTKNEYRIAIRSITKDTNNTDNIGVQSFYIIVKDDDSNSQYAYWGDGKFTSGIHVGIKNTV